MIIRFGVIGCGSIAERLVIPSIINHKSLELVAISSRDKKKAEYFGNKFSCKVVIGYDKLLEMENIDAVYISLPPALHKEWTIKALKAGKHVLVEKPSSISYKDSLEMVTVANQNNLLLMENYMFEYHSQQKFIKNILTREEVGEIRLFKSSFGFPLMNKNNFRYKKYLGGGVLLDAAGYPIKATQMFLGKNIEVKYAKLNYNDCYEVDMYGSAVLVNEKGQVAQISFGFDSYYQCIYEIWGSKGKIIVERAFTAGPQVKPKVIIERQDYKQEFLLPSDNHCENLLSEFINCVIKRDFNKHIDEIISQARLIDDIRWRDKIA